jgi:hypothetical protein
MDRGVLALVALAAALLAAGCVQYAPVPPERTGIVGCWSTPDKVYSFRLHPTGRAIYYEKIQNLTINLFGPAKFSGSNMTIDIPLAPQKFVIKREPYEYNGMTLLTIDRVTFVKIECPDEEWPSG